MKAVKDYLETMTADQARASSMETRANTDQRNTRETKPDESTMMTISEAESITMQTRANAGHLKILRTSANAA